MRVIELKQQIAASDSTFERVGGGWVGKCLICKGWVSLDAQGHGANIEHIVPRNMGGTNDLRNLGLTHPRCNAEKGVHWDEPRRRRKRAEAHAALVKRLLEERRRRWREPGTGDE